MVRFETSYMPEASVRQSLAPILIDRGGGGGADGASRFDISSRYRESSLRQISEGDWPFLMHFFSGPKSFLGGVYANGRGGGGERVRGGEAEVRDLELDIQPKLVDGRFRCRFALLVVGLPERLEELHRLPPGPPLSRIDGHEQDAWILAAKPRVLPALRMSCSALVSPPSQFQLDTAFDHRERQRRNLAGRSPRLQPPPLTPSAFSQAPWR